MEIREKDIPLVKAFIAREIGDFRTADPLPYETAAYNSIVEKLAKLKGGADGYKFISLGNTGCHIRELFLEAAPFEYEKGNIEIVFSFVSPKHSPTVGWAQNLVIEDHAIFEE